MSNDKIGIGRRKTAVSSVILRKGTGVILVNNRALNEYFLSSLQRDLVMAPLVKFDDPTKYDVLIRVKGGGVEAQAIATRLGISRALLCDGQNEEMRSGLKELGFLTRDPRKKERKKYGQKGARKRFQFSKR